MIYYVIPDAACHSGGINLLWKHLRILKAAGIPAERLPQSFAVNPADIIVIPEVMPDLIEQFAPLCRLVSIVLNPFYVFNNQYQMAKTAITNSSYTRDMLEKRGTPTRLFTTAVREDFYPKKKELRICWIPRKTDHQIEAFRNALAAIDSRFLTEIKWYTIDDLTDEQFAETFRTSLAFLSLSTAEGWPGVFYEAMRCRTLVCTYKTGQPYLHNVISAESANFIELAANLGSHLRAALDGDECYSEALLDRAYEESLPYTTAAENASVIQLWRDILEEETEPLESIENKPQHLKTYARKLAICTPMPLDETPSGKQLPLLRGAWHRARMQLVMPMGYNTMAIHVDGMEIAEARNKAVELALREKCKYLFFLDWDVIAGPLSVSRLVYVAENYPEYDLISGLYTSRSNPCEPLMWRDWDEGVCYDWTFGESVVCEGVPAGCLLIRMSLFDRMNHSKPFFVTPESIEHERVDGRDYVCRAAGTEDLYFCKRATEEAGAKILCDTRVNCGHQDRETGEIFMLGDDTLPMRRWRQELEAKKTPGESSNATNSTQTTCA